MEDYKSVKEIAAEWNMTERAIRNMCQMGKIEGANKIGDVWAIPSKAQRPIDKRIKTGKYKRS